MKNASPSSVGSIRASNAGKVLVFAGRKFGPAFAEHPLDKKVTRADRGGSPFIDCMVYVAAHPNDHLAGWRGILQADAYGGYNGLYDPARPGGAVTSALCWSHARRGFFELADIAALLAFPVHLNPCVQRVLENSDHVAIADRHPVEAGHATLIGRAREVDLIGLHREQHLARAAKLTEASEDQPDHLLEAQIRIQTEPCFTVPDVAERYRYPQLPTSRLGTGCIHHPRSQHAELELADAAFHAQEQAIIRPTRIVDALEIDDAGFDEPT